MKALRGVVFYASAKAMRERYMKECKRCGEIKPISAYYSHGSTLDRKDVHCIACTKEKARISWIKRKDTPEYREYQQIAQKKYTKANPLKAKAHRIARRLKAKLLKDKCEHCGNQGKLHMHHPDYTEPLEVLTLCILCHERIHHER